MILKNNKTADIAVVGAGIMGLAIAYTAAKKGLKVIVFERNTKAIGASIRNFGLIWPIGQAPGKAYERALNSRKVWQELVNKADLYAAQTGCLHLVYNQDELAVLEEFMTTAPGHGYQCQLLTPEEVSQKSSAAKTHGLLAGLWSTTELTVDPREVISQLPAFLESQYSVQFRFGTAVTSITMPYVDTAVERWQTDHVYVCSGADFETLYPSVFAGSGLTKCKLQMMRTGSQPGGWQLGPALCAGLTLRHYASFRHCTSLAALDKRVLAESPEVEKWGIHVLLSQTRLGELTIGDSHEYDLTPDPFDKDEIDQIILNYLHTFAHFPDTHIAQRWHGIYPKLPGQTEFIAQPEKGVTIVNGLSGAGMTLSFGLAEEVLQANAITASWQVGG
ncbi:TIGR03364 family FAD-dependent oxidoreductase [Rhodocytophaga aerolata]|uniref:TIGR03364 family FAD-dependent oxidoreductase n=1 Tax=Rhodocytophaga aerolata TaxID=455078 RepID=A0ABT8RBB2_9BACT|nr:TIGR03364 family FAD-dependent oxidoreductase [Rhodocytophaga aerolata]MDO1448976.1 TIGR03364 family FAD-dependent oxidoreductase [Rhodocytophaga aerolata]